MICRVLPVLVCVLSLNSLAQEKKLEFEVASIKPNNSGNNQIRIMNSPGRFNAQGATVKMLIMQAYNLKDFQITGGPAWLGSDRFDIEAKTGEGEDAGPQKMDRTQMMAKMEQLRAMMRSLLADRFNLKFHEDSKEAPAYALVTAKNGPKMKKVEAGPDVRQMVRMGMGQLTANATTMEGLANQLSNHVGRPVVDKTGLEGNYDVELKWTPDPGQRGAFGGPPSGEAPPPVDANGPTIFTAVQEQLGLRLDGIKMPQKVLIIDSIEKPSAN